MRHRRSCFVKDTIMQRYDQELLGAPLWCTTQQEGLWIQEVNAVVLQRRVFMYDRSDWRVGLLQCSHSLKGARQVREQGRVVEKGEEVTTSLVGLNYPKAKRRLERRTRRSTTVPQRRIYRSRRNRCKVTNSRAMGLTTPWYRRGGTSVESSILCSHRGRALVIKGVEEVENTKANSKYQDRVEGQRPRNFIRPERSRQYAILYLFYSEEYAIKVMEKTVQSQMRSDLSKTYSKLG
ncbi:hypothetical protein B296_00048691 [Ensete ventricosum]|uniref:Uncharacterized protein n=1 Tax=Ensete ventricosum TaxID=4639 RepID=A0A426Y2B8_ENSVE|nr:hypothetical protein B296_00048691 [Ensete ventricosum]